MGVFGRSMNQLKFVRRNGKVYMLMPNGKFRKVFQYR